MLIGVAGPFAGAVIDVHVVSTGVVVAPIVKVAVPVEVNANPAFANNTTDLAADTSNAGLTFLAPVRLENAATTF